MQYRVGTCASCNATFKVPATFPADKAKCKSCEDGIVEIGPPVDEPEPEPETFEEYVPSSKSKKSGPSMMEKLRAQRAADAAADAAPPAVPSRKPATARDRASTDASGEEAKPAAGKKKSGSGTGPKTRAAARRAKGKSSRSSASGSRRSGADDDKDDGTGGGTSGRWQPKKKKSPLPFIGSLVGAVLVAFIVWKFVLNEAPVKETPSDTTVAQGDSQADDATTDEAVVEVPTVPEPEEVVAAPAEESAVEPTEPAEPVNRYDPSSVDLSTLERFEAQEGTTPTEWDDIQQLTALAIDPDAGAAGARAVKKLVENYGPKAFGSIVNRMTKIDYSTEQGFRDGDVLQRALMDLSNGKNAGWAYSTSDKDHLFNKKVVKLLHKVWARARTDEAYWLNYSKQDGAAEEKEDAAELTDDDLDALDDIDF